MMYLLYTRTKEEFEGNLLKSIFALAIEELDFGRTIALRRCLK
jgi:hypothetical protein